MQGLVSKFQLYGQTYGLCAELSGEQLIFKSGLSLIANAVYQRDALPAITETYDGFNALLSTRPGQSGSLKNFETRFFVAATKFNSLSNIEMLSYFTTALMLLSNKGIEHSQRESVVMAAVQPGQSFTEQSRNDEFLNAVINKQLANCCEAL